MKQVFIITVLTFIGTLNCQTNISDRPTISPAEGLKLHENPNYIFLDIRTFKEHNEKAITNSVLIPLHELEERLIELHQYSEKIFIVYCRSGNRSKSGTDILIKHKFEAFNLLGGILSWKGPLK